MRDETRLHTNYVQVAGNKAADACKSVVEKWNQGKKVSMLHFTSLHVVYDRHTAAFYDNRVNLATVDGRFEADYVLPADDRGTPIADYFSPDEYVTKGAELHYTNGKWLLHIHCKMEVESDTSYNAITKNGTVL